MVSKTKSIKEIFNINTKEIFIVFFSAILVYLPVICMELPNPDAVWNGMAYKEGYIWEMVLNRFMIPVLQNMTGHIVLTSMFTIVGLLEVVIGAVLITNLLDIEGYSKFFADFTIVLSPFVYCGVTYYYCFVYYGLAMLLSVMAFYVTTIELKGFFDKTIRIILPVLLLCISLGIYQAYLGLILPLGLLFLFKNVFKSKSRKDSVILVGRVSAVFFMGTVTYIVVNKLVLSSMNLESTEGRGFNKMGQIDFSNVVTYIKKCYVDFKNYFFGTTFLNNEFGGMINRKAINTAIFGLMLCEMIIFIYKSRKNVFKCVWLFFGILFFPIFVFIFNIVAPGVSLNGTTGPLVLTGINIVYLIPLMLDKFNNSKLWRAINLLSLIMVIFMHIGISSSAFTYLKYRSNKQQFLSYCIAEQVSEQYGYDKDERVCIIGKPEDGNYPERYPTLLSSIKWTTASYGLTWDDYSGLQSCWQEYMKHYLSFEYNTVSEDECNIIKESNDYKEMPIFPNNGSVLKINDIIVVKFSDVN